MPGRKGYPSGKSGMKRGSMNGMKRGKNMDNGMNRKPRMMKKARTMQ